LAAGLALFSKYQAGLTLLGALVYLLTQPAHRHWLRRLDPWLAALVALVAFLPVLAWNATHGWSSFAFQGGRAAAGSWHPFAPLLVLGGEALFVLPWIWLPMMACLLGALRRGPAVAPDWLFSCLALPPILLFAAVSVWSPHVLFHWAAPGYLMLFPLLGRQLAAWTTQPRSRRFVRFGLGATVALGALSAGIIGSEILWRWAPDPAGDLSLQAMDWRALGPALDRRGLGDAVLAGIRWHECGKLGYALGRHKTVLCLTPDAREFAFSTHPARHDGSDVLIVTPHGTLAAVTDQLGNRFDQIDPLPPVTLENGGRPALEFSLFLGRGLH
jgi:hypothetical protein